MGRTSEKVLKILSNKPFVQGMLVLSLIIALANPLGLPITIGDHSRNFYNIIESIEPGSKILLNLCAPTGTMGDLIPQSVPLTYQLLKRGDLKLFFVGVGSPDHIMIYLDSLVFEKVGYPEEYGLEYGVDWVNLGYVPGLSVTMETFGKNIRAAVTVDRYGTPIDDIEMMKDVESVADFDIVIYDGEKSWLQIQFWTEPFNIPLLVLTHQAMVPMDVEPWFQAGQITEYLAGVRAGADYEVLVNRPGEAVAALDALSISHFFLISLIIIGNIIQVVEKYEKKEGT